MNIRRLLVEADPKRDAGTVERVERLYASARGLKEDPQQRLARRQAIAAGMEKLRAASPERLRGRSFFECGSTTTGCSASAFAMRTSTGR